MSDQDETPREIVPAPVVLPAVSPQEALQAWRQFLELKQKLLDHSDYQIIMGKKRPNKSAFRKLAVVFNLSDRILEQERIDREDGSFFWRVVVEVQAPNGRICTGVAICDSRERNFAHPEHDIFATCHTRAKNRGISDMIAGGVVSAEEIEISNDVPDPLGASTRGREEVRGAANSQILSVDGVIDTLQSAGLETDQLQVSVTDEKIVIRSDEFMGKSLQAKYSAALRELGLEHVRNGKDSRWEGLAK